MHKPTKIELREDAGVLTGTLETIEELADFIEIAGEHETTLYRGQEIDRPLLPRIARIRPRTVPKGPISSSHLLEAEKLMLEAFKREATPFLPHEPGPDETWRWLTIARHHDLPTRLLDWSENPLMALWFAVSHPPRESEHGVLWQFVPSSELELDTEEHQDPFDIKNPIVLRPSHIEGRVRAQFSIFTVHNYVDDQNHTVPFETLPENKKRLIKLIIPPEKFAHLRYNLDQFGIDESVIFPDIEALCHNIEWRTSILNDEVNFQYDAEERVWRPG